MRTYAFLVLSAAVFLSVPAAAQAQTVPLSEVIYRLLVPDITLGNEDHAAHFRGYTPEQVIVPLTINSTIATQLASVPIASSSGGFLWVSDPTLGTYTRRTNSFGPAFAERAFTGGAKRWSAGFNYQRATYDTFEGKDLDGEISVYLLHADCCPPFGTVPPEPFFEGDVIRNTMNVKLTTDTFTFFANYGVTSRFDVGISVPVVSADIDATVTSEILRLTTEAVPQLHVFPGGATSRTTSESASATGIGDVILRGKYALRQTERFGLAAGLDLRLPTGDDQNLLGTGSTQTKLYFVASGGAQRIAPHVNVGYSFAQGESDAFGAPELPNEFSYTVGFDAVINPRLTFAADLLGRSLQDTVRLEESVLELPFRTATGQTGVERFDTFTLSDGTVNLAQAVAGIKWNPRGNLLLSAHALFPLTDAGLRDNFTAVIGIDYSWSR